MFLIFVENRVDNREMFLLLLSSAFIVSVPAPCTAPPVRRLGAQEVGRRYSQDSCLQRTTGMFQTMWHHAQYIKLMGDKERGIILGVIVFVFLRHHYT